MDVLSVTYLKLIAPPTLNYTSYSLVALTYITIQTSLLHQLIKKESDLQQYWNSQHERDNHRLTTQYLHSHEDAVHVITF
jgi:hypothetical protein